MNMKETTCTQIGQGMLNGLRSVVIVQGDDAHSSTNKFAVHAGDKSQPARFALAGKVGLSFLQKLLLLESPEQWQTVLPELAEETYLPEEHLPLQSYLSRS